MQSIDGIFLILSIPSNIFDQIQVLAIKITL